MTAIIGPFDSAFQVSTVSTWGYRVAQQPQHLDLQSDAEPVATVLADDAGVVLEAERRALVLDRHHREPTEHAVAAAHRDEPEDLDDRG